MEALDLGVYLEAKGLFIYALEALAPTVFLVEAL
jgi:hypothetical protein